MNINKFIINNDEINFPEAQFRMANHSYSLKHFSYFYIYFIKIVNES